ncbi:helix-turn-helix transcriptional regulator [uncultured Pseudoflavonifractor sp.]|uniref:PadR family transcriptional regulator n=1 Tax=uncultured Pseudoflavonifractor sp. TaxID=1221379 RepID=UPI0025E372FB|nr:helix-turn-helix transcriptional regulator [uncultured Pseudoflavonifractor sp.]
MEYLVLGLLSLSPMTGYELQQFIRQNLALICSHSAGSVHAALSKLEREGRITAALAAEGGRRKKIFSITESGRAAFSSWVAQPMQAEKVKNMELSRLFFLGLAKPEERSAAIQNYIRQMEETEAVLRTIRDRFRQAQENSLPPGQDWDAVFRFQAYTIAYGIAAAQFEQDWYRRLLCELEEPS